VTAMAEMPARRRPRDSRREELENELFETKRRLNDLAEATTDLVCTHTLDGTLLSVNQAASRALDIPAVDLAGMNLRDLLTLESAASFDGYLATVAARGVVRGTMSVVTRAGQVRVWQYENRRYGNVVSGAAHDVTDTVLALRKVKENEQLFRSIIENASDAIAVLTPRAVIHYHNPAAQRALGYASDELIGSTLLDFVHAGDADRIREFFARQVERLTDAYTTEVRLRRSDGVFRSFEVATRNVVRAGQVEAIILNARDITDRRLLEWQLEQANRVSSLGRLAATVAHEFNNVLMGIQPFAELLDRPNISAETLVKCARYIGNSIQRGKRVALDILRFTQSAAPERKPLRVQEWLARLLPEIEAQCDNGISFVADIPARPVAVMADGRQLAQVITNLANNARDAMPRGGSLTIRIREPKCEEVYAFGIVEQPERFIQLSVVDTGTGIPADVITHIFEPLFTTKRSGGTGLGLAVAHQVVQRHGGSIFADSTPGAGSAFHIFLPKLETAEPAELETQPPAIPLRSHRILIVDDEQTIVEGMATMLRDRGFQVSSVATGCEAAAAVRRFRPEVVLLDIGLPDMDGVKVGVDLRTEWPTLPIAFCTGHGDRGNAPADDITRFMRKPFTIDELLTQIAALEKAGRA
jgi:two-component system, cell cycle sensor histidine kinase and response regulator CckA